MNYFKQVLKGYLILALEKQIRVDSDTHAELDGMLDDLEKYIDKRIAYAIEAHETENGHIEPYDDNDGRTSEDLPFGSY